MYFFFVECRMAGTANDYIGTLSRTRSGRTCAKWLSDYDLEQMQRLNTSLITKVSYGAPRSIHVKSHWKRSLMKDILLGSSSNLSSPSRLSNRKVVLKPVHRVDRAYLNDSLYPERSVRNASNYCRDPSRNIAGTWCYTTDPQVPQDLCDVRDCEKPGKTNFCTE